MIHRTCHVYDLEGSIKVKSATGNLWKGQYYEKYHPPLMTEYMHALLFQLL